MSSPRRWEERCPAVACGIGGAVRAIRARGIVTCAPYGTRILAGSWQRPQGDETHGSSFPVDVHSQGKSKTLCPQSRPRAWVVSHATALAGGFREVSLLPSVYGLLGPHLSPLCFPPRKTPHRDLLELLGKAERDGAKDVGRRGRSLLPSLLLQTRWTRAVQEFAKISRGSGES